MDAPTFASTAPGAPVWELSGWWKRVGAQIIDNIVATGPLVLVGIVGQLMIGDVPERDVSKTVGFGIIAALVLAVIWALVYYPWIMAKTNGQTVGKESLSIRVVREDGAKMTAGYAFVRQVLVISILFEGIGYFLFAIPMILNYLWPLWDSGNQALHDKIVKSRVVLAEPIAAGQAAVSPPAQPMFPQAPAAPAPPTMPGHLQPPVTPRPPAPPPPPGGTVPYAPPPGFDNPVPDDEK